MSEHISRQSQGQFLISGELNFSTAAGLARQGNELFKNDGSELVLDLSGVSRSDSAGLALLIEWRRSAERRNQSLVFNHIPQQILDIADVSGVETLLQGHSN